MIPFWVVGGFIMYLSYGKGSLVSVVVQEVNFNGRKIGPFDLLKGFQFTCCTFDVNAFNIVGLQRSAVAPCPNLPLASHPKVNNYHSKEHSVKY